MNACSEKHLTCQPVETLQQGRHREEGTHGCWALRGGARLEPALTAAGGGGGEGKAFRNDAFQGTVFTARQSGVSSYPCIPSDKC